MGETEYIMLSNVGTEDIDLSGYSFTQAITFTFPDGVMLPAGESLYIVSDGVKQGFANEALRHLSDELSIPIIASGGAGTKEHFRDAFIEGHADAALAASVFHFGEIPIPELKQYLCSLKIPIRL